MFNENYIIKGIISCETGLHIGNSNDNIDIGGSDKPVIRDDFSSSESVKINRGKPSRSIDCVATQIFGIASYKSTIEEKLILKYPTRIIVRDSYPTDKTIETWKKSEDVFGGAELKYENLVDRINANSYLRNIERIPRGSEFNFEIIFSVYEGDNEKNFIEILRSMQLLEDNYLGGSGSRGFGKVKFKEIKIIKRDLDYYREGIIYPKNTLCFDSIYDAYIFFKKGLEGK